MNLVICGSMKVKEDIIKIGKYLTNKGYNIYLPVECLKNVPKVTASRAHFNRIINADTDAILVINNPKDNIKNYIGPNTFAEIAFAFFYNKKIYLLNDIYEPYKDELEAWNVIPIHNNLDNLK